MTDEGGVPLALARQRVAESGWASTGLPDALLAEVLASVSRNEVRVLAAVAAGREPAPERLHAAVATFARRALRNLRLAYALMAEPAPLKVQQARLTWRRAIADAIAPIVRQGQLQGAFGREAEARLVAAAITAAFMECLVEPLQAAPPDRQHSRETAHRIAHLCCTLAWPVKPVRPGR